MYFAEKVKDWGPTFFVVQVIENTKAYLSFSEYGGQKESKDICVCFSDIILKHVYRNAHYRVVSDPQPSSVPWIVK